jgi:hypothetical protein
MLDRASGINIPYQQHFLIIHMFLALPDPDLIVGGMDPDPALDLDPSIIMQK